MTKEEKGLAVMSGGDAPLTAIQVYAQVQLIQEVMKSVMKKGTHYGTIQGCGNALVLFKPGAETLAATFKFVIDPEVEEIATEDGITFRIKCKIYSRSGVYLGCGIGEASTKETKYLWRGATCEAEYEATPADRRQIKYFRNGGTAQQVRTNVADVANTVLKMAKKRGLVDGVLTITAASDIFTQDLDEDFVANVDVTVGAEVVDQGKVESVNDMSSANKSQGAAGLASKAQVKAIYSIASSLDIKDKDDVKKWWNKELGIKATSANDLTMEEAGKVIDGLQALEGIPAS